MARRKEESSGAIDPVESLSASFSSLDLQKEQGDLGWGLDREVRKKLLLAIEDHGGFRRCTLANICRGREHIYGKTGTKLRQQVRNKFNKWKNLSVPLFEQEKRRLLGPPKYDESLQAVRHESPVVEQPRGRTFPFIRSPSSAHRQTMAYVGMPWERVTFDSRMYAFSCHIPTN